ncbi:MAG: hypothetical protein VX871_08180 [Pseudomonadota bacterium]|nr:hypothetical protein [Pseudomonadota bacterium]
MQKSRLLIVVLVLLAIAGPTASVLLANAFASPDNGLECVEQRVVAYGWTNADKVRAEMGAILRWQNLAARNKGGYNNWHQAEGQFLSCHRIGGERGQYQCKAAALPCRPVGGARSVAATTAE